MAKETFIVTNTTTFKNPYTEEEQSQIIQQINNFGEYMDDSDTLRLDKAIIEDNGDLTLELSPVSFYDFLSTNYAYANRTKILDEATKGKYPAFSSLVKELEENDEELENVHTLLSKDFLANTLCISCLVRDETSVLMVKRQLGLPIDGGLLAVPTGTVRPCDLGNNVIFNSCARELSRLGIKAEESYFNFHCLMRNDQSQPCACTTYVVSSVQDVLDDIRKKNEFFDKYVCGRKFDFNEVKLILKNEKFSSTTKFQLESLLGKE